MYKISVIVPIYNKSKYLKRCINSILSQTLKDIEIILINDGSTDNSLEIINNYEKIDSRIKVFNQKNVGLSETRNRGILLSTSEVLSFIDSDDFIEENMFENMYNIMISENSEMVYSLVKSITSDGEIIEDNKVDKINKNFDFFKACLTLQVSSCIPVYLFRKSLFMNNSIEFPKGQYYEDAGTTFKLAYYANKISVLNEYYYNYYNGLEDSITSLYTDKHLDDIIQVLLDTEVFLKKERIFELYHVEYEQRCYILIREYILFLQNKIDDDIIKTERIVTLWKKFGEVNFCDLSDIYVYKILFYTLKKLCNVQKLSFLIPRFDILFYDKLIKTPLYKENVLLDNFYKYISKDQPILIEDIFANYTFSVTLNKYIEFINNLKMIYKRIILYGAGNFTKFILSLMSENIVLIVDKNVNIQNQKINDIKVKDPNEILNIEYDIILIAVLGRESEIFDFLKTDLKVDKNKIVFFNPTQS